MNKILELREKRVRLWNDTKTYLDEHRDSDGYLSKEDEKVYEKMQADVVALGKEIEILERQSVIDRQIDTPSKPPIGIKPFYVAAWQRIGELIGAIERQYESHHGNPELVEKWANEITWQCSIIEALREPDDEF